jgi:hypothetical protein
MELGDALLLSLADKLLIGVVLLIAGLWLNERLEVLKGQIGLQNALAQARADAFGALWKATQPLTPRADELPSAEVCKGTFAEIRKWYYSEAGAMHLSFAATNECLGLLKALEQLDGAATKEHASALRTQLKLDIGVYTKPQARKRLPNAG